MVDVQAQVFNNVRNWKGGVIQGYWRAGGFSEGEGDLSTFLCVGLDFPFVEPGLAGVEMFLEVEGCCGPSKGWLYCPQRML
jgi:hypothetical protein